MAKRSAGILLWKREAGALRVLLVHPGGPFWAKKDAGAWTIPKGEYDDREEALAAAQREYREELGCAPDGDFVPLGEVKQKGGKLVTGFACNGDFDVTALKSNTFDLEWPPRSGKLQSFPEVDRAQWFTPDEAREKINSAQAELVDRLERTLKG